MQHTALIADDLCIVQDFGCGLVAWHFHVPAQKNTCFHVLVWVYSYMFNHMLKIAHFVCFPGLSVVSCCPSFRFDCCSVSSVVSLRLCFRFGCAPYPDCARSRTTFFWYFSSSSFQKPEGFVSPQVPSVFPRSLLTT